MENEKIIVTGSKFNAVVEYLRSRPYDEVAVLIHELINDANTNLAAFIVMEKSVVEPVAADTQKVEEKAKPKPTRATKSKK